MKKIKNAIFAGIAITVILAILFLGHTIFGVTAWKIHLYFLGKIAVAVDWVMHLLHHLLHLIIT